VIDQDDARLHVAVHDPAPMRRLQRGCDADGDAHRVIDLEWAGSTGYWLELRRCFSFGKPTDKVRRFWELRQECYAACVEAIRPGASSEDILTVRDAAYAARGFPPALSLRYSAHGIGLDSLEPPWVPGKARVLKEGMVLSLHPDIVIEDEHDRTLLGGISIADNVLVTADGAECLSCAAPREIADVEKAVQAGR